MKTLKIFAAALAFTAVVSCSNGTSSKDSKNQLPSQSQIDSVSYLVGMNFGSFIKNYDMGELNFSKIKQGIEDVVNAKGDRRDSNYVKQFKINPTNMNQIIGNFLNKRHNYKVAQNSKKQEEYFAKIKKQNNVKSTASGLCYSIESEGQNNKIGSKDTVFVHYVGSLQNGTVFDQTKKDGPSAKLVLSSVIPGWTEGLQLVGEGGSIKLYIPSSLAYGEQGQPRAGIEPNSPLIFDIQVDSVKRYVQPEPKKELKKK